MTEICLPASLRHARSSFRYIDNTGVSRSPFGGGTQTTGYGGDRVGCTIDFTPHGGRTTTGMADRSLLEASLMSLRGKQNRLYLQDNSYTQRGSFPATELFTNADFSNGTTGWTSDAKYSMTAADNVRRSKILLGSTAGYPGYQSVSHTPYAPYVTRALTRAGRGTFSSLSVMLETNNVAGITNGSGYAVVSAVAQGSSGNAGLVDNAASGQIAGDYIDTLFMSCSRCFHSDSGGNLLTKSREIDHADWTKNEVTVTANAFGAQDATVDADALIPSTNNASHYVLQAKTVTSSAVDLLICGYFRAVGYNFIRLQFSEGTGGTAVYQVFNLNTGAVGTTTSTGANWSGTRAAIRDMGNGWYYCALISRKTNAATTVNAFIVPQNADNASNFAGNGTSGVALSKATMFPSGSFSLPVTSTTASVAASSQTGSALNVKGLPVSTTGLLLPGDWVEIDGQLKKVTASLDSDAAGQGYLQFSPTLRRAVSDNTPIIVNKPMGRFILAGDAGWSNDPGVFSSSSIDLEEAWA